MIVKYPPPDIKEPDRNIDYKADLLCSIFYETIRYWYDRGYRTLSKEDMVSLMLKMIFTGVVDQQSLSIM